MGRVFRLLIAEDKALEINTRRLGDDSVIPPLLKLYKRFRELGGRYATLGSDAHYKEHVAGISPRGNRWPKKRA